MADEKGREDFSLKDYQCQPPKLQFQDLLRDPVGRIKKRLKKQQIKKLNFIYTFLVTHNWNVRIRNFEVDVKMSIFYSFSH